MARLYYWTCSGCGETLEGIRVGDDFISDKEMASGRPRRLQATGCYVCGSDLGEFGEEVPEANDED